MIDNQKLENIAITPKSYNFLQKLLAENPKLEEILNNAADENEAQQNVKDWVLEYIKDRPEAYDYYKGNAQGKEAFDRLSWRDYAAIRILDYIDNAGTAYEDMNLRGAVTVSDPIKLIWLAVRYGNGGATPAFFEDMLYLFRQFSGTYTQTLPDKATVLDWMDKHIDGLDPRVIKIREENRDRIINIFIDKIDTGEIKSSKYSFSPELTRDQKYEKMLAWWKDHRFHLSFAVRSPDLLNEFLGNSLDIETMNILYEAQEAGIPFFVNPYYLSLLNVHVPSFAVGADLAIRYYVLYTRQLIEEFGHIVAWEKEDVVEPGKPNAAGWILPTKSSVHRRYPEVAILIPATTGRTCGGLCASCQRMYDFQRGNLNFNLEELEPDETWDTQLKKIMEYWETDTQLRDILITGGDALMSSDTSLKKVLDAVVDMALSKREANKTLPEGEKKAEIVRVRLGTRLLAYLPQRVTQKVAGILSDFRKRASDAGIKQFIIQTHFESPMEITPEAKQCIDRLISAGWIITNQHVFTAQSSRRGHTAKLRKVLGEVGVLPYYNFTVKGYRENYFNFATNARSVQEQIEEKVMGQIDDEGLEHTRTFYETPEETPDKITSLMKKYSVPFLATDRNVLNLPGVGKSLTFRTIGITYDGRRILEFDHDPTRTHSPIIHELGKVIIIESKPISDYLKQLDEMGEDVSDYESIWGYSIGETEPRLPIYEYPDYDYELTEELSNLEIN